MRKFSEGYRRDQTSLPVLPLVCHFDTSYSHRLCLTITCNRDVIYKAGSTWRIAVPPQADRAAITGNTHTEELGEVRTGGFWADRQTDKQARSSQHSAWLPRGEGGGGRTAMYSTELEFWIRVFQCDGSYESSVQWRGKPRRPASQHEGTKVCRYNILSVVLF